MIARLISRPCAMAFVCAKTGTISTQECIYWLSSKRRFSEMGIALLLLSWGVELVGGDGVSTRSGWLSSGKGWAM